MTGKYNNTRGFTIFFAMLVGGLALAVGAAIYDLTVREIDLSAAANQSQYAIYAADTGVECALYWDAKAPMLGGLPSVFSTSSASQDFAGTATCNGQNIRTVGTPPASGYVDPPTGWLGWSVDEPTSGPQANEAATTTFTLMAYSTTTPRQSYCAVVQVGKATISNILYTTIISKGYNNCHPTGVARLERTLRVNY